MDLRDRIAEIEQFIRYANVDWPELRPKALDKIARRCEKCIASERYSPLRDGICESCRKKNDTSQQSVAAPADRKSLQRELTALLKSYEGRASGNYDALVLFSGGKDSAYLLNRLRTEYPALRLLAVTIDNGFFSQVAMQNARRILERISDVDHLVIKPRPTLYKNTFRYALTHLNEGGCYTTVDRMDGDLAFDIGRNFAASLEIPLMVAGLSTEQIERIFELKSFETDRNIERSRRTESAGFPLEQIYGPDEIKYWWDGTAWPTHRVPRVIYPFYAWDYDEQAIREEVVRRGLIEPGQDNPLITNNDTIPVMVAVDICFLGYSGFEPEFAELVRLGKADRTIWLNVFEAAEYLTKNGNFLPRCIDDTLTRLDLTRSDVGIP